MLRFYTDNAKSSGRRCSTLRVNKKRLLAIGMIDSVHFARWLEATAQLDAIVTIFPSGPNRSTHPKILHLLNSQPDMFFLGRVFRRISLGIWLIDRFLSDRLRSTILARFIKRGVDVVHFHEMQSGGYPLRHIPHKLLANIGVFYTPYGSDLYWYGEIPRHRSKIRQTLERTDAVFPECQRDGEIARRLGFSGEILASLPAAGWREIGPTPHTNFHERNKIVIKSYGGRWSEVEKLIQGLGGNGSHLHGFELHFISVSGRATKFINRFREVHEGKVLVHKKFSLSTFEVERLLSESKYYVSISKSDGFPSTLFEALSKGVVPIQSDTACIPNSLASASPDSFIDSVKFSEISRLIRVFEERPHATQRVSEKLLIWANENQHFKKDLAPILREAYQMYGSSN